MSDDPAERSCEIVRRYVTEALFAGSERALLETVSDPELSERAWLFWAAFSDRSVEAIDVLFASVDGAQVGCHFTGTATQQGPWIAGTNSESGQPVTVECTGTYVMSDDKISAFHETWS